VLEAAQLQADLRRAGIEPWAWVINQSLAATYTTSPVLQQRAAAEAAEIATVASQHAARIAVLPLGAEEPIGAERLAALAG
jgi:arsenite-transporting ATPase